MPGKTLFAHAKLIPAEDTGMEPGPGHSPTGTSCLPACPTLLLEGAALSLSAFSENRALSSLSPRHRSSGVPRHSTAGRGHWGTLGDIPCKQPQQL